MEVFLWGGAGWEQGKRLLGMLFPER